MPPAQVHARPGSPYDRPTTPSTPGRGAFTSPQATPQGSPSKKQLPPGANELPNVFENALKLNPTAGNPSRIPYWNDSPTRTPLQEYPANDFRSSVIQDHGGGLRSNQENTPPGMRPAKESASPVTRSQAALSRQDQYRGRDESAVRANLIRLSPQDFEKAQKPSVKRLANVTQLC